MQNTRSHSLRMSPAGKMTRPIVLIRLLWSLCPGSFPPSKLIESAAIRSSMWFFRGDIPLGFDIISSSLCKVSPSSLERMEASWFCLIEWSMLSRKEESWCLSPSCFITCVFCLFNSIALALLFVWLFLLYFLNLICSYSLWGCKSS